MMLYFKHVKLITKMSFLALVAQEHGGRVQVLGDRGWSGMREER